MRAAKTLGFSAIRRSIRILPGRLSERTDLHDVVYSIADDPGAAPVAGYS